MSNIKVTLEKAGIEKRELTKFNKKVEKAHEELHATAGSEEDFVGWLHLPTNYDKEEFARIKKCAEKIKQESQIFIVIGVGGSYLGAKAVIDSLTNTFYNSLNNRKTPQIFFVGNNISPNYMSDLLDCIGNKDVSINVISKSGTTTEPAIAFRIFRDFMESKYGTDEARNRIYITTDKEKGALRELAKEEEYETFVIPSNIGGRFSVLTAVGLLPIAVAGIDIDKLMYGAKTAEDKYNEKSVKYNECYQYAVARNILYNKEKNIEILVNYEPKLQYFSEWWKQLYGESEGKDNKGLFPASVNFSTDLHSMGQYIQDGARILFETVLNVETPNNDIVIDEIEGNIDGLNFLAGKTVGFVNSKAFQGTLLAHTDGNVPNMVINIPKIDAYHFGNLVYFFEKACGVSGYVLAVNPFNQPGVEAYKNNMFALLGKPGYEGEKEALEARL